MKLSINAVLQILALLAQILNATTELLPGNGRFWAMVGLSVVQGITAILAHFVNPDGTSVAVAYIPDDHRP